jgi:hypothetical protein
VRNILQLAVFAIIKDDPESAVMRLADRVVAGLQGEFIEVHDLLGLLEFPNRLCTRA